MPAPCALSDSGEYAVRHNPFVYYTDFQTTSQCNNDVPYIQLSSDPGSTATTPNYVFITPNLIDDMHDGTIAQGDTWLSQNVPLPKTRKAGISMSLSRSFMGSSRSMANVFAIPR
jgi:hypothetical protein